jgi:dTDP-4-amino-4,6-dideoxygalactose transaminase
MRIGRTIPPAAAPVLVRDLRHAFGGAVAGARTIRARAEEIRRVFGLDHVFLVSSGSAALTLSLLALKSLASRTDVVIPAYTCFSVPAAVLKAGLRPVLCDIDPVTFDFNPALLEAALTGNTLCVISHHLFGVPSDVDRTRALCRAHQILVVEDAAQAMGGESRGRKLGTIGDVGIFSFGRGKNITCGSGGAVVTRSGEIAAALAEQYRRIPAPTAAELARDLIQLAVMAVFIRPRLYWIPAALPFLRLGETVFPADVPVRRLAPLKAGLLQGWEARLVRSNRVRSQRASYFRRRLSLPANGPLPYLRLPILARSVEAKQRLYSIAKARGLGLSAGYPTPISDIPQVRRLFGGQKFPAARRVAESLLTIPTHHWVSAKDQRAIADLCSSFCTP